MKRTAFGLLLLVVLLLGGILMQRAAEEAYLPGAAQLRAAADCARAGDWQDAAARTAFAWEKWEKKRPMTAITADHEPMEEISSLFEELALWQAARNADPFCGVCIRLSRKLEAVGRRHSLSWQNFL